MSIFDDGKRVELDIPLPPVLLEIAQSFEHSPIHDVYEEVKNELATSGILEKIPPRSQVAVAAGSRGVANIRTVVKAVVDVFLEHGCEPFVTPAMGSHGGGTAEGQIDVLASFGITEDFLGVPVRATMEVKPIGQISGGPVLYQDRLSAAADCTFLINRVKPHTDFHGPLESGLTKMAVIGLGKRYGASEMHEWGAAGFRNFLVPAARIYEAHSNVIGGLALVENAYEETERVQALHISEIGRDKEMQLLEEARRKMGSLAFKDIDVLVVKELGKNISGTGMDTNIIGRLMIPREEEFPSQANIAAIAVLSLTEETHGNASGIGLANVTTHRTFEQIDWHATYTNSLTSGIFGMQRVSLPIVMPDDRMAIQAAVRGCGKKPQDARIVFIESTLHLERMWISPNLREEAQRNPKVEIRKEILLSFSDAGVLISPWALR